MSKPIDGRDTEGHGRDEVADSCDPMLRLADLFATSGEEMRLRSLLGAEVIEDPAVSESAELSGVTYAQADVDIRSATTGRHGLLARSVELDADALILRATVVTYRWIDDLQSAAYKTLGSIASRAIGYLAPEVELGGAIVSAGLIETDALDRDGIAAYLDELAENNPELMEHVTSGGGGLLDGLQMRSLLTVGILNQEPGRLAAPGGLRAIGVPEFLPDCGSALRDTAGGLRDATPADGVGDHVEGSAPRTLEDLLSSLETQSASVFVQKIAADRFIAYLPGLTTGSGRRLRLVGGHHTAHAVNAVRAIEAAVGPDGGGRVMLVGSAQGGATATEIAATLTSDLFVIDQVVTIGAPSAQVPRIPEATRVLSLEDRSDPVALLGSLINADAPNRMTVVFQGRGTLGASIYSAGGRAADNATHPALKAEITRIRELGYLAG